MTTASHSRLRRLEHFTLGCAALGLAASAILGWRASHGLEAASRLAVFACLQPALGSLIFVLIFRLTGGQWMDGLAPFLMAGVRLLPWVWLLAVPLLAFGSESSRHVDASLRGYFSRPMLLLRATGYAAVFFLLAAGASRVARASSADALRWLGPAGLIGLVFTLHLLAVDWLVRLEPGWRSTGFPLVWMTGQAVAGLAAAMVAALWLGANPAEPGRSERSRGLDWGNLLLAAVMAWIYVAFVHWLIIWSGNLPAETAWYRRRSEGAWAWVWAGLVVIEFAVPFALLLSRRTKRSRRRLAFAAAMVLAGQFGHTIWLIAPSVKVADAANAWLCVALCAAGGGLFFNRYLAGARKAAAALAA